METIGKDIKHAGRLLFKQPAYTVVVVLTLALGIGSNTAIFSLVHSLVLRPLPYRLAERLAAVWPEKSFSKEQYVYFRDESSQVFEAVAAYSSGWTLALTEMEPTTEVSAAPTTANFFQILGARPALGRTFAPGEDQPGAEPVVILSHEFWHDQFAGDPNTIGRQITLQGTKHTVIGVMPATFRFPRHDTEVWVPLVLDAAGEDYKVRFCFLVGRLRDGTSIEQASQGTIAVAHLMKEKFNGSARFADGARAVALQEYIVGGIRPKLLVLLGAVCLVLLIACVNVSNLLLVRAISRAKEFAVRSAMGAGRRQLIQQMLIEYSMLTLLGGAVGLLTAMWGVRLLARALPPDTPRLAEIGIDPWMFGFTLTVSVLTVLIVGLGPALQASRTDPQQSLRGSSHTTPGAERLQLRRALAISELALAAVLIVGAGLLIKSLWNLYRVDPGFRPERVLTFAVALPDAYSDQPQQEEFYRRFLERLTALPQVVSCGMIQHLPLRGFFWNAELEIQGRPKAPEESLLITWRLITPEYLRTMGIPVRKGRGFSPADRADAPAVALVNETMARKFWPGEDPIGKSVKAGFATANDWVTIVGVVGDVKHDNLNLPDSAALYRPYGQNPLARMNVVVRTRAEPMALVATVRSLLRSLDRSVPVAHFDTMEQLVHESSAELRLLTWILVVFASLALVLGAVGVYGVMSYAVGERTHEIGIRMTLGARKQRIIRQILGEGVVVALAGIGIGLLGGWSLTRFLGGMLFEVTATDPLVFVATSVLLVGVTLLACYLPARRASRLDPQLALRQQ